MENWERLIQIADQLAAEHPASAVNWEPEWYAKTNGQLLVDAETHGAFSLPCHAVLRTIIEQRLGRPDQSYPHGNQVQGAVERDDLIRLWDAAVYFLQTGPEQRAAMMDELGCYHYWLRAGSYFADIVRADAERLRVATPLADKKKQGEGNGVAGSATGQPAVNSGSNRKKILASLQPAARKAYFSYQYAETMAEERLEDHEAYGWLKENGIDASKGDIGELADYKLPAFATWRRQVSEGRRLLGEQKYTRRAGRATGRSIVSEREI